MAEGGIGTGRRFFAMTGIGLLVWAALMGIAVWALVKPEPGGFVSVLSPGAAYYLVFAMAGAFGAVVIPVVALLILLSLRREPSAAPVTGLVCGGLVSGVPPLMGGADPSWVLTLAGAGLAAGLLMGLWGRRSR